VLVVFSTSGRSENIRRALLAAANAVLRPFRSWGKTVAPVLAGRVEMLVQSKTTARIQEMHQLLLHTVCELIEEQL